MGNPRDTLFQYRGEAARPFAFDARVAKVFPDMIRRSVPGYSLLLGLYRQLAGQLVDAGSNVYDLGCSLGAVTLALREGITAPDCRIVAVDNAPAMVDGCRQAVAAQQSQTPVEVRLLDITELAIHNASLVVLNFTLQFLAPQQRAPLLSRIRAGLRPGGAVLLAEKLRVDNAGQHEVLENWHRGYKRACGYSELEIARKREALDNVLVPDSATEHLQRLRDCGFERTGQWFQCFNFAAFAGFAPVPDAE